MRFKLIYRRTRRNGETEKGRTLRVSDSPRLRVTFLMAGFTLLEVILVLFLISLILGLSTIFFANTMPSNRLNATAREISATIRYAKTLARVNSERHTLTIDLDSKLYGIDGSASKNIPDDINIKVIDPLLGEVHNGKYPITFYETGGIEGGTIVLFTKKKTVKIELDPVVGSVVIK